MLSGFRIVRSGMKRVEEFGGVKSRYTAAGPPVRNGTIAMRTQGRQINKITDVQYGILKREQEELQCSF